MKKFEGFLKSEIKKIEGCARKHTGNNNMVMTGYSVYENRPFDFDQDAVFMEADCEICEGYDGTAVLSVHLTIPMFDRRRSYARVNF